MLTVRFAIVLGTMKHLLAGTVVFVAVVLLCGKSHQRMSQDATLRLCVEADSRAIRGTLSMPATRGSTHLRFPLQERWPTRVEPPKAGVLSRSVEGAYLLTSTGGEAELEFRVEFGRASGEVQLMPATAIVPMM
jgi:hypothetical protein